MKKFALFIIVIVVSHVQAMNESPLETKKMVIHQYTPYRQFFDLLTQRIESPYRILERCSALFYYENTHERIKSIHSNHTIFNGPDPILIVYNFTQNADQQIFLGYNLSLLEEQIEKQNVQDPIILSVALLLSSQKKISSGKQKLHYKDLFKNIKSLLEVPTFKSLWIKAPSDKPDQSLAIILQENPSESYVLLQDGQIVTFHRL
jgi:hypothetical protein